MKTRTVVNLDLSELLFGGLKCLLLGGSREQRVSIATLDTKHLQAWLSAVERWVNECDVSVENIGIHVIKCAHVLYLDELAGSHSGAEGAGLW